MNDDLPILYSFRRCPYAMRARMAIVASGLQVQLREIVLRDKAPEFLDTSPTGTVPCLKIGPRVIDQSLNIMAWALVKNDPLEWMQMPIEGYQIMADCDGPFKTALDRTKYTTRHPDSDPNEERAKASEFITRLEEQLTDGFLYGPQMKLADVAVLPFVRQFAHIDMDWFIAQDWPKVIDWLQRFETSELFETIMPKFPKWVAGDDVTVFP